MTVAVDTKYDLQSKIEEIVGEYGAKSTALIMILQDVQKHYRYLPEEALRAVAKTMKLPLAQIYGVATFYRAFTLKPKGRNHICVCTGTACHVRQAVVIVDKLERDLGITPGETTADGEVSLETVNCLGACALGPLVTANGIYYGNMTVTKVERMLSEVLHKKHDSDTTEEAA
ncbi:MAG: NAD(P)H-dependent oxidoreductase subunit E [candidate division Zixibacteria bacterium]|nr:NAD(P)H-dependent oxidoreductase subunit E [candidate division Zixibacteria bacterium]